MHQGSRKRRKVPGAWPVILSALIMIVVTTFIGLKLDADSASIQPERYARFLEGARLAGS